MYNFLNFDNDTRFIMVSELVRDIENKVLFTLKNKPSFMQINSGLSLKI